MSTLLKLQTITAQVVCMTTSELLGSLPASEELLEKYIKSKALKELQKLEKQLARAKEPEWHSNLLQRQSDVTSSPH